jgi:hypothetical protein
MKKRWILVGAVGAIAASAVSWAAAASNVEQPAYKVLASSGDIEIREYGPMIVAEANVKGERQVAMSGGFRIIADYIFGNNISSTEVAMTSPVTQQASEKIAMTAPVIAQPNAQSDDNMWKVRFIMPSEYTMETLPAPANPAVSLIEIPTRRVAAITFSGRGGDSAVIENETKLNGYLAANNLTPASLPTYASYDPPWTPPFMRRNEVLIDLQE